MENRIVVQLSRLLEQDSHIFILQLGKKKER